LKRSCEGANHEAASFPGFEVGYDYMLPNLWIAEDLGCCASG
jgi:hypothetical protein